MVAREARDFAPFRPALEHVLDLQARYIACFDGTGEFAHPYDVLLDDYEPGLTTAELRTLFARLQDELVPLVSAAAAAGESGHVFPGHFPVEDQRRFVEELLGAVGYETEHWRLDASVHPFARSMAPTDVRLTTRWEVDDLAMAFYSSPARVRARALRGADGPAPLPDDARGGHRARRARVAEPAVGEPRGPLAAVLRVGAAGAATPPGRAVRGAGRRPRSIATSTRFASR